MFLWYLETGKRGRLLSHGDQGGLSRFLQDYTSLAWLHQIQTRDFSSASTTLRQLGLDEMTYLSRKKVRWNYFLWTLHEESIFVSRSLIDIGFIITITSTIITTVISNGDDAEYIFKAIIYKQLKILSMVSLAGALFFLGLLGLAVRNWFISYSHIIFVADIVKPK